MPRNALHYEDLLVVAAVASCCPLHRYTPHEKTKLAALPTTTGRKPDINGRTPFSYPPCTALDAGFVHWELFDGQRALMISSS